MVESSEIMNDNLRCRPLGITLRRRPPGIRCRLFVGSPESRVAIHSSKSVDGMGPSMPSEAAAQRSVEGPDAWRYSLYPAVSIRQFIWLSQVPSVSGE